MNHKDKELNLILQDLKKLPELLGNIFSNQNEAITWTHRLAQSGYPVKRRGRRVWLRTDGLRDSAVKMVRNLGFTEIEGCV